MRTIITGGTGLIGSHLAEGLLQDGHEVILLSRSPEKKTSQTPRGISIVGWDARTADGWGQLVDGADAIVNLAGENLSAKRWTASQKHKILQSRLNAGQAVVEAVRQAKKKPGVLIQASGVNYYGPHGDEKITEESLPGDDFLSKTVVAWEASTEPVESMGVRRVVTRSGVVLSMEGVALPRIVMPFRFFVGGSIGSGEQWMSWTHIEDEVSAIRFLIANQDASGVFNLTSPNPVKYKDLARIVGEVMHRPSWIPVPAFAVRLLFGEMSTVVLDGQRVLPERLLDLGYDLKYHYLKPALEDLLS